MNFFELYHMIEDKNEIESLATDVYENFQKMEPLDVIGKVRQLAIFAAHGTSLTENTYRILSQVVEALANCGDEQLGAAAQQLYGQLEITKERI